MQRCRCAILLPSHQLPSGIISHSSHNRWNLRVISAPRSHMTRHMHSIASRRCCFPHVHMPANSRIVNKTDEQKDALPPKLPPKLPPGLPTDQPRLPTSRHRQRLQAGQSNRQDSNQQTNKSRPECTTRMAQPPGHTIAAPSMYK